MNKLLLFLGLAFITLFLSTCKKPCEPVYSTYKDKVPTEELCQAAFQTWFYDADKETCELKAYSACSKKGFDTEKECWACKCNKKAK